MTGQERTELKRLVDERQRERLGIQNGHLHNVGPRLRCEARTGPFGQGECRHLARVGSFLCGIHQRQESREAA